jgi:hypothetical protein
MTSACISCMTATAGLDIPKQVPQKGPTGPEGGAVVGLRHGESGDSSWQQFVASLKELQDASKPEDFIQQVFKRAEPETDARGVTSAAQVGSRADGAEKRIEFDEVRSISFPSAAEEAHSSGYKRARGITPLIGMGSPDPTSVDEAHVRPGIRTPRKEKEKEDGIMSAWNQLATPPDQVQGADVLTRQPGTAAANDPMPSQVSANLKPAPVALAGSLDNGTSDHAANEVIHQTSASKNANEDRRTSEKGDVSNASVPRFSEISKEVDGDGDSSAGSTLTKVGPHEIHAGVRELAANPKRDERSITPLRSDAVEQGTPELGSTERQARTTSKSVRSEPKQVVDTGSSRLQAGTDEWKTGNAAGNHAEPAHVAQIASVQVRASEGRHFEAAVMHDPSIASSFGSHKSPQASTPLQIRDPESSGREVFAALDAGSAESTPKWVRAGAHQAEAGYQDPDIGWVSVRAHARADGVHAALVPSSTEAAQSLGGHLSTLSAYLADHHSSVQSVSISAPEAGWNESFLGQGSDQNTTQHGTGNDRSGAGAETESDPSPPVHSLAPANRDGEIVQQAIVPGESRYISVVA